MISEYIDNECRYKKYGIKNVYVLPKGAQKLVVIDEYNEEEMAYVDSLEFLPTKMPARNASFSEEVSLDERYLFNKTLTFTIDGHVNLADVDEFEHALIELEDGTVWMVNIDFPAKMTYTYTLSDEQDETFVTMSSLSNYPTLFVRGTFNSRDYDCKGYVKGGIDKLMISLREDIALDVEEKKLFYFDDNALCEVVPNKGSLQLQEVYDGTKKRVTLTFSIDMNSYKPSWHYNLLEFYNVEGNKYSAVITKKNSENTFYIGFNEPLTALYNASAGDEQQGDIFTITMQCDSIKGIIAEVESFGMDLTDGMYWRNVKEYDDQKAYECVGVGKARYLLQQETDLYGGSTGRYRCLEGYEKYFESLGVNIVGTFTEDFTFYEPDCLDSEECQFSTTIPYKITYHTDECKTYTVSSGCDWRMTDIPLHLSVTPTTGRAMTSTIVTICNRNKDVYDSVENQLYIHYGMKNYMFTVVVERPKEAITPLEHHIDCTRQYVYFTVLDNSCRFEILQKPSDVIVGDSTSYIYALVPSNPSTTSTKTYRIYVRNCEGQEVILTIYQDKTYEKWVAASGYICDGGSSYQRLQRYTATTDTNEAVWEATDEYKKGDLLVANDVRCGQSYQKYEFRGNYVCQNGCQKFELLEEVTSNDGQTWTPTGKVMLGKYVGEDCNFCNQQVQTKWVLSDQWVCE